MTIREAMNEGRIILGTCDVDTLHLDVSLLMAHTLGIRREQLYMELTEEMLPSSLMKFQEFLQRRKNGEPVAWIIGHKEFWGRNIMVGPGVLTPRPDSEILIERTLNFMDSADCPIPAESALPRLHDCCTGPGTLALTLAVERPGWQISAGDISEIAGKFFHINNQKMTGGTVRFTRSNLLEQEQGPFEVIISNPPYLTPQETAQRMAEGWKEPALALDGGGIDGLDILRRLVPQAFSRLVPNGALFIEAAPPQMPAMRELVMKSGFDNIQIHKDLGKRERVIQCRKPRETVKQ